MDESNPRERFLAEAACQALINRFAACLDGFDDDGVLALVTPDCIWHGSPFASGHQAIRERLAARPRSRRTLHLVAGAAITLDSEAEASGRTGVTVYRFDQPGIAAPSLPHTIGIYQDRFRREGGRWLIAERSLVALAQA